MVTERYQQEGNSHLSCSWGRGDGTCTEGLKCLGIESQRPSAAVQSLFGTWHWLGPSQLRDPF